MDGSISGRSGQWGITRLCKKVDPDTGKACGHTWAGGIGVQQADFSKPMPIRGQAEPVDDRPLIQHTGPEFRNPSKNFDGDEE